MPHLSEPRYPTPFVRKREFMNSASAKSSASGSPKSDPIPIVFVVDDDVSVRESLEALIRFVGWQPETFASAAELQALRQRHESLTPREREVMRLVVAGMLNKQIGMKLGISEITVKAHRGKMMQKMKAESLADLVKTAVRLGLAPARNPWHT